MPEAIELLQGAWSTAYKEVGKQGEEKVPTIDMVTGRPTACTRLRNQALAAGGVWLSCCPTCCCFNQYSWYMLLSTSASLAGAIRYLRGHLSASRYFWGPSEWC